MIGPPDTSVTENTRPGADGLESSHAPAAPVLELLRRMRLGDREAAAAFMGRHAVLIRTRYRHKLGRAMRRLFDSQELLSTVSRRLDLYVRSGRLEAATEAQLWALVFRIADNSLADKVRIFRRLRDTEGEDSEFARGLADRIKQHDRSPEGSEEEIDRLLRSLASATDREILSQWLGGSSLAEIADSMGLSPEAARKRWQRIRELLKAQLQEHAA
ncbi:MAG: hypothetical protein KF745_00890 [Phycisphaeraceae bacterium]|nr:hypothetical protein [Phycisphaeraceae bacterium]